MILADDEAGRRVALAKLLPMQRSDFEGLFKAMQGHPVTVRLLDPPLHEFVPHFEKEQRELAKDMNVPYEKIAAKVELLAEVNPMLGHRGCRLGNTYPEITEMQTRAIIEAAMNVKKRGFPYTWRSWCRWLATTRSCVTRRTSSTRRPRRSSLNATTAWNTWSAR